MQQTGLVQKVALEGGNTLLLIACPVSFVHCRPAQLPLCLSAPRKRTHLLLCESLWTCTLDICCNCILDRNQCAPSAYLIPSTSSMSCSAMLGPHVCSCVGACHAKAGKGRLLPSEESQISQVEGKVFLEKKKIIHFESKLM